MSPPTIAIVGAGPAGLTLAKLLHSADTNLSVTIFEHSASAKARHQQGGTLDLHPESGLLALRRMGLHDAARPHLRYEGEELVIADLNGCELVHMKDAPPPADGERDGGMYTRPEIDRERLVEVLLEGVEEGNVRWGKHLKRIDGETGKLEFEDGSVEGPFDLVVGADGAWSKVRSVLSDVMPGYSGICGIEGHIDNPKEFPRIDKLVGRGSFFSFSYGRACMAQRMGDNSIKLGTWQRRPETFIDELVGEQVEQEPLRKKLLEEYRDWCPEIRELIEVAHWRTKWKLYELPVGHKWEHKASYTLIGDSAHLATPFAGMGVNAAMLDALELSDQIITAVKAGTSLDRAVEVYEQGMFPRGRNVQERTMLNKTNGFADDAPLMFMSGMIGVVAKESGWPIDRGLLYWIPITRTAYSFFWMKTSWTACSRRLRRAIWGEKSLRA
ncbi:uncharacterized protein AB675_4359 [Cyphellophora attinorum]|uniref:FAD-binding domain-containing protein n=1 Tax=Cyphellophora attinorum TaxID=1664694 RepID=A0A0N1H5X5_9EURO|nr:uncharacterized protein AB675_4359 [Phialophora attinorum]KPI36562.1 hypothetical protein AB675_4359 [Phialophora attinorum]